MIKYILLFVISLTVFLTIKAPASILQDEVPNVVLSGKLLNGSAWHKQYGTIYWQFNPAFLLRGNLAFDITLSKTTTNIKTTAFITLLGNKKITNTSGTLSLDYIKNFYANIPQFITTNIGINSLDAQIISTQNLLDNIISTEIVLNNSSVMGEQIGNYQTTVLLENNLLELQLKSTENSAFNVDLTGNTENNFINLKGSVKGNTDVATSLLQTLNITDTINYRYNLGTFK